MFKGGLCFSPTPKSLRSISNTAVTYRAADDHKLSGMIKKILEAISKDIKANWFVI